MKILVTGEKGQLGSELKKNSHINNNFEWIFTDRRSFNISDLDNIYVYLNKFKPNIFINCAAYTSVDKAETEFQLADFINHMAVDIISRWTSENNKKLIHISTDYVFDGKKRTKYLEDDIPNPISVYGQTKLNGEKKILKLSKNYLIFRVSWLFSEYQNLSLIHI